ncbi:F-box domain [Macleaya cordata]|uniref:F-box domain n=1 Tax=Macleaya cordata TaxID=56857 RepID=A0A200PTP5_MACCD|nr:F-box domain [Macleaya cordata]
MEFISNLVGNSEEGTKQQDQDVVEEPERSLSQSSTTSSKIVVLPRELIYEILTRASLDHLLFQCRFVCKDWRRLTYDSNFRLIHSQRTPTVSGYLLWTRKGMKYHTNFISYVNQSSLSPIPSPTLDYLPTDGVKILSIPSSSSHGLLCYARMYQTSNHPIAFDFYICKPATREWRKIRNPNTDLYKTMHIAVVVIQSNPLHYKVIRFSTGISNHNLHCEVFDSIKWKWEMLDDVRHPYYLDLSDRAVILLHGAVHWLTSDGKISVLNFEDGSPKWKIIASSPNNDEQLGADDDTFDYEGTFERRLVECEGEVGLLYLFGGCLELWLLKDYYYSKQEDKTRWNKIYRVNLKPVYDEYGVRHMDIWSIYLYTMDIVLMTIEDEIIWYDCKTGTHTVALKVPSGYWVEHVHPIHSDLVPCNLMSKRKRKPKRLISLQGDHEEKEQQQQPEDDEPEKLLSHQSSVLSTPSSIVVLPRDVIIYEILTRGSLRQLLSQCRLVCKDWRSPWYESNFKLMHSLRTPTISGYFISMLEEDRTTFVSYVNQSPPIPSPSLDFLPNNEWIVSSSSSSPHGLVCCTSLEMLNNYRTGHNFYICKPATREWQKIPNPKKRQYITLNIGIVVIRSNPLHYKLIRNSMSYHCHHVIRWEIFDSNNWKWKMLINVGPPLPLNQSYGELILVHGAFHCLTKDGQIFVLNVNEDNYEACWKIIASTPNVHELGDDYPSFLPTQLVEHDGEIGLLYLAPFRSWLELWVLEDYYYYYHSKDDEITISRRRWTKKFRNDLTPLFSRSNVFRHRRILELYTNDIVLMEIDGKIIWYNCKTGTETLVLEVPDECLSLRAYPIHSDLVPC